MKIYLLFMVLLLFQIGRAQEKIIDLDSLQRTRRNEFIKKYSHQLNIKVQIDNDVQIYEIPVNNKFVKISPNIGLKYALNLNYRFLSIGFGIRPRKAKSSIDRKGETAISDFKIGLYFNRWSQKFKYNKIKGFYIKNEDEIFPSTFQEDNYMQLPMFRTRIISGNTGYKLNDNYSLRSTKSQTEIQLKSVGSFIPNINYSFYKINGSNKIINKNGTTIINLNYNDYSGVNFVVNLSYYYNFVVKKWFFNMALTPGVGGNFYKKTGYNDGVKSEQNLNNFVWAPKGNVGIGYNGSKIYFGTEYFREITRENSVNSALPFQTRRNGFFAYFGYRFRAPKAISVPVIFIEDKIPILQK